MKKAIQKTHKLTRWQLLPLLSWVSSRVKSKRDFIQMLVCSLKPSGLAHSFFNRYPPAFGRLLEKSFSRCCHPQKLHISGHHLTLLFRVRLEPKFSPGCFLAGFTPAGSWDRSDCGTVSLLTSHWALLTYTKPKAAQSPPCGFTLCPGLSQTVLFAMGIALFAAATGSSLNVEKKYSPAFHC